VRILVLGSTGMLGHKVVERLRGKFDSVIGVSRPAFDVANESSVRDVLSLFHPDVVFNCVGLIKQREQNPELSKIVNAQFPRSLQKLCAEQGSYLIHFSTDCVFSGKKGMYTENDATDPVDVYGATKALGEIETGNCLTIRTSIIGRERNNHRGLLEWFLKQQGIVLGYTNAIFSGVTTTYLSDTIGILLKQNKRLTGLYQIASPAISKYGLLRFFQSTYGKKDVQIIPTDAEPCDRSLNGEKFRLATGIKVPGLEEQLYWMKKTDDEGGYYVV